MVWNSSWLGGLRLAKLPDSRASMMVCLLVTGGINTEACIL